MNFRCFSKTFGRILSKFTFFNTFKNERYFLQITSVMQSRSIFQYSLNSDRNIFLTLLFKENYFFCQKTGTVIKLKLCRDILLHRGLFPDNKCSQHICQHVWVPYKTARKNRSFSLWKFEIITTCLLQPGESPFSN